MPFYIPRGPQSSQLGPSFSLGAPTVAHNAVRVLRALQLRKAVLLEGSPGVGKTSLVGAIARASGVPASNPGTQKLCSERQVPEPSSLGVNKVSRLSQTLPCSMTHSPWDSLGPSLALT